MKGKLILISMALLGFGCQSGYMGTEASAAYSYKKSSQVSHEGLLADTKAPPVSPQARKLKTESKIVERELSYEGEAKIVTDDMSTASQSIRRECKGLGGYLFSMSSSRLDLRIPSKQLESFIAGLGKYGQLKSSSIQAEDVTDKHFDLKVRISNAEQLRKRLLELSDKSKNVDEALKLERELARVTAELERIKGLLIRSVDKVEFSKLVIHMSSPEPLKRALVRVPFSWVNSLAENMKNPSPPRPLESSWFSRKIEAELPDGFASFYNYQDNYWAMNGKGAYYHIQRVENQVPGGSLKFWEDTVSRFLQEGKLMTVVSSEEVISNSGKGFQIRASYGAGKNSLFYVLQVVPGEDKILISEIWGEAGDFIVNADLFKEVMQNVKSSL